MTRVFTTSRLLIAAAVMCLCATVYVVAREGANVYFIQFHRPLNLAAFFQPARTYVSPAPPTFHVTSAVAKQSLSPGDTQTITVTAMPDVSTTGYLEVWIYSPQHKEIYKSPLHLGYPQQFAAHISATTTFLYTLPGQLQPGAYSVSDLITSSNQQTDYYVNENFDTFKVL